MKIFLAADHAGFELKEKIKKYLLDKNYETEDCGAFEFKSDDDYPDFVEKAALKAVQNNHSFAIVFGKSGTGEAIVANKINGIRAVVGLNTEIIKLAREHNNANVLSLGSSFADTKKAKGLIELFLNTPFLNEERHIRRIKKITEIEKRN